MYMSPVRMRSEQKSKVESSSRITHEMKKKKKKRMVDQTRNRVPQFEDHIAISLNTIKHNQTSKALAASDSEIPRSASEFEQA